MSKGMNNTTMQLHLASESDSIDPKQKKAMKLLIVNAARTNHMVSSGFAV